MPFRARLVVALLLLLAAPAHAQDVAGKFPKYTTPYYVVFTDIDPADVDEVGFRLTRMFDTYVERTRGFTGQINSRLPFTLFKNEADYHAAGGVKGSAGVFMGDRLMVIAGKKLTPQVWKTIQHEGFHQFVHAVIRGDIPPWINEGLAEYFGESVFTGDDFVSGVAPVSRTARVKKLISQNGHLPLADMMKLSQADWNGKLRIENYDQAWSMVHFLLHGDDGKYAQRFEAFMRLIGRGTPWPNAWGQTFGTDRGFEEAWAAWWLAQPESPTPERYARAYVLTVQAFLARTHAAKTAYATFDQFVAAAALDTPLPMPANNGLPMSLLREALRNAQKQGKWELRADKNKAPTVTFTLKDGSVLYGTYTVDAAGRIHTACDHDLMPPLLATAREWIDQNQGPKARRELTAAIARQPRSPSVPAARAMIAEIDRAATRAAATRQAPRPRTTRPSTAPSTAPATLGAD